MDFTHRVKTFITPAGKVIELKDGKKIRDVIKNNQNIKKPIGNN